MASTPKSAKKSTKKNKSTLSIQKTVSNPLDCEIPSALSRLQEGGKVPAGVTGFVFVLGVEDQNKLHSLIDQWAPLFQKEALKKSQRETYQFVSEQGPVWIFSPRRRRGPVSHHGRLEDSVYSSMRDQIGAWVSSFKAYQVEVVHLELHGTDEQQELGLFTALEMAAYNYRQMIEGQALKDFPRLLVKKFTDAFSKQTLRQARALGGAVNLARHLVNTPPNFVNPSTLAQFAQKKFKGEKNVSVEIWDAKRLSQEGMNLHLGVGQGALHPPCLIHLKYRPRGSKRKPIAFVGKGITFDTGGLDIKPSSGMRLMKKDMGGAAAVLALAHWAVETQHPRSLDFYLAMAENSVDAKSFRPSDVLQARNGMKIEIHNTDAEGRLVLADALDVAVTQKGADEPEMVIDVATLTGAIKVALGSEIAGLFSNEDGLAESLNKAGQEAGDLNWRMPLLGRYMSGMATPFADLVNAQDGFGGAITAALFLEKFVRQKPWAHLDIYAWNDKAQGPLNFSGGSGQAVQCLARFLSSVLE